MDLSSVRRQRRVMRRPAARPRPSVADVENLQGFQIPVLTAAEIQNAKLPKSSLSVHLWGLTPWFHNAMGA